MLKKIFTTTFFILLSLTKQSIGMFGQSVYTYEMPIEPEINQDITSSNINQMQNTRRYFEIKTMVDKNLDGFIAKEVASLNEKIKTKFTIPKNLQQIRISDTELDLTTNKKIVTEELYKKYTSDISGEAIEKINQEIEKNIITIISYLETDKDYRRLKNQFIEQNCPICIPDIDALKENTEKSLIKHLAHKKDLQLAKKSRNRDTTQEEVLLEQNKKELIENIGQDVLNNLHQKKLINTKKINEINIANKVKEISELQKKIKIKKRCCIGAYSTCSICQVITLFAGMTSLAIAIICMDAASYF